MVRQTCWVLAGLLLPLLPTKPAQAGEIDCLNASIRGQVLDFTRTHDCDRRIWSDSLSMRRDMYVYVPPGYDPDRAYPLLLWLHGFGGDEEQFTRQVVRSLDESIASGAMPPVIAACPDLSVPSRWKPWRQGSWCINGRQGQWEDYVVCDVFGFLTEQFKIRSERELRVIAGWSMGGFGAYSIAFKHPEKFGVIVGVSPNVNIRYADKQGHWGTPFSPETIGALEELRWGHWLGRYPKPWRFPVNAGVVFWPAWGSGPEAIARMSAENPYELLDQLDIQPGQYDMFIAYGRLDEYHVDNQVDSFLYKATERGLDIWVRCKADGHHSSVDVIECMPDVLTALGERLGHSLRRLNSASNTIRTK